MGRTKNTSKNKKSLSRLAAKQGLNGGREFGPLSRAGIWPKFWGRQLPNAMGHGSGVFGLVEGLPSIPVCGSTELLSEVFWVALMGGCITGFRIRSRTRARVRSDYDYD
jgi:hypothetical protein